MRIFLISPVHKPTKNPIRRLRYWLENRKVAKYVKNLENQGHDVYWPKRDTDQNDPKGGIEICKANGREIYQRDEVHIWWTGGTGSIFDFGMTFMLVLLFKKKVVLANPNEVKKSDGKALKNVLLALHSKYPIKTI